MKAKADGAANSINLLKKNWNLKVKGTSLAAIPLVFKEKVQLTDFSVYFE